MSNHTIIWLDLAKVADILSFSVATITVFILIYLIVTTSPSHFGNYTHLMILFAINSWVFAWSHAFLQPVISIEKYVLFVFSPTNYMQFSKRTMQALLALYGITYSQTIVFIAVQFVYRYLAVCKRKYLYIFDRNFLFCWYLVILLVGLNWGACIFFIAKDSPEIDVIIEPALSKTFNLDIVNVNYVAASYYMSNGVDLSIKTIFMVVNFGLILGVSFTVILACIFQIRNKFGTIKHSQDSQDVLVFALIFQMLVPFFLIYLPIIIVLILPAFQIQSDVIISTTSILISLYPLLDPVVVIVVIPYYREGFVKLMTPSKISHRIENLDF